MIARIDKEKLMNTVDGKLEEMKQNLREKGRDTSHKEVSLRHFRKFVKTVGYDEFVGK